MDLIFDCIVYFVIYVEMQCVVKRICGYVIVFDCLFQEGGIKFCKICFCSIIYFIKFCKGEVDFIIVCLL